MEDEIARKQGFPTASFASGATKSGAVNIRHFSFGCMYLPAEFNSDTITFEGAEKEDGTFAQVYDKSGNVVTMTAAGAAKWYELHGAVMGCSHIKVVTNNATGGAASVLLSLKT